MSETSKRTVTLKLTTQRDLVRHETSARTYGELKRELSDKVNFQGVKVIERTNKVTLEADEAVLPATDFMLFLVPQKVKSGEDGASDNVVVVEEARVSVNQIFDNLIEAVKNAETADNGDFVIQTTMDDLDKEMADIRSQLNI